VQRGRNPPWHCHCPDCRRGFARPHVCRRGQANGLRNVRLRVLRQSQRRVAQRVETIFVLLVLVLIWLVARSTAEPLPSRSRERFAVSLATHCLNAGFPNRKDMGSYQNYTEWPSAVVSRVHRCLKPWERKWLIEGILKLSNQSELCYAVLWCLNLAPTGSYSHKRKQLTSARWWEATLTRANEALRDVERLMRLGCGLQAKNTRLRLERHLTSAMRGSLPLARELRCQREVVFAHVPPHEVKR